MAKKKKGGGMSAPRKWGKKILSAIRVGVAIGGYSAMTVQGIAENVGNPTNIPAGVIYRNTGVDVTTSGFSQDQLKTSLITVGATTLVLVLLSFGIKHI